MEEKIVQTDFASAARAITDHEIDESIVAGVEHRQVHPLPQILRFFGVNSPQPKPGFHGRNSVEDRQGSGLRPCLIQDLDL